MLEEAVEIMETDALPLVIDSDYVQDGQRVRSLASARDFNEISIII